MTQEEKQLLLIDLCARLPYGVKIYIDSSKYGELIGALDAVYPSEERIIVDNLNKAIAPIDVRCGGFRLEDTLVKPYLRPMESMTEEEKKEYKGISGWWESQYDNYFDGYILENNISDTIDWLNEHHFDYRGLIEKGLALEAPEGMYKF